MLFFFAHDVVRMVFLFLLPTSLLQVEDEKKSSEFTFRFLGRVEEKDNQCIFDHNRDLYDFRLQELVG